MTKTETEFEAIQREVVACRLCPRLVAHREAVAARKVKRFADETYWGRPVPAFGDPRAKLLIVGLAPAAHGANRTGRMFTGDRSGDFLYETLHLFEFASQASASSRGDGLQLAEACITAAVRCAPPDNKPSRTEFETCRDYLLRELTALGEVRVVLALGKLAFDGYLAAWAAAGGELPKPKPKFGHGEHYTLPDGMHLLVSYHPSQQNTFTGRLTRKMFNAVLKQARQLLDLPQQPGGPRR